MKIIKIFSLLLTLVTLSLSCQKQLPQEPVIAEVDYGQNDYLPLAIGNIWKYYYSYTRTSMEYNQPQTTTTSNLGTEKWEVTSVRDSLVVEGQIFTITKERKEGNSTSIKKEEVLRTKTYLYDPIFPRTGTTATVQANPVYKKGVGIIRQTWGSISGGPGSRGTSLYALDLYEYKLKP